MKSRTALAAEAYLDSVYALLANDTREWANRPSVRERWMMFAVAHVKSERRGFSVSTDRDFADAIEIVWRECWPMEEA